jgi:uncharacterized protein YdeI (YjbR/CyaY-like superfamily)
MTKLNPKVTEYIAKSADFAKPILNQLRELILSTCPDADEDVKWGTPHYAYKGDHLCMMGAFKNHCSFSLYKAEMMKDKSIQDSVKAGKKFGYMDKLKSIDELPAKKVLVAYIKEAMAINESGVKKARPKTEKPKLIELPDYFVKALKANGRANKVFNEKSDAFRKDYIIWVSDAKTEDTRQKRLAQSLEWIAEGKGRFWQYAK